MLITNKNAKLITTTNPVMEKYVGLTGEIIFNEIGLAFFYTQTKFDYTFRTSLIQRYENNGKTLTLFTLNSVYSFEILGNVDIPVTVQFSANRQKVVDYLKDIKSKRFYCILDGGPLRGIESIVTFNKEMTKKEAIDFITANEVRDDIEDELVENIIGAADDEGYLLGLKFFTFNKLNYISEDEFEKAGLLEPLNEFMFGRKMLEYKDTRYISINDALDFFKY